MNNIRLTWLGHSCFQIDAAGITVLIDPFITDNPKAIVRAEELNPDIIAVTHGHDDHLGDTVSIAKRTGCTVVCIHEMSRYLGSKGIKTAGMNIGGTIELDGILFTMTDARHSSSIDESSWSFDGGRAAGFVIRAGIVSIYHAGDTGIFGDMELISRLYHPDVAILPIGGRYTMDARDAALAVGMLRPGIAIPMHYNTFDVISQDPNVFCEHVKTVSGTEVVIMEIGSSIIL
ncbi:metal-dependent hydrolase [Methanolobus psychrotolerans]|uniref:metal-dependent hydrolase n=1 Tax=Methanolobus psychrotolerans TaxID=1874706 RepID=UPI000B919C07|nr:metal-dependent hydrolase [Methanolobus psychrotolerans]